MSASRSAPAGAGTLQSGRSLRVRPAFAAAGTVLLLSVFALNVYRAATQSITHDEALTFQWYVNGPITRAFGPYVPNNHVLHSLLAWMSVHTFGLSELTLRLPSLLGGLLYLLCALRLCRRTLGGGWISLLGFGLLALNPLVLDFLSAARGYGLALAFWLWALLQVLAWFDERAATGVQPRSQARLARASLGVGLSAACHLTLALPGAGLLLITASAVLLERSPGPRAGSKVRALVLLLPGAVLGAALWLPSLLGARAVKYVYGLPSLLDTSENLVSVSLAHHAVRWPIDTAGPLFRGLQWLLARLVIPLLLLGLLVRLLVVVRRALAARSAAALTGGERLLLLAGGTLMLSLLAFLAAHLLLGALYPQDRWGLSLILLFVLAVLALAAMAWDAGGLRRAAAAPALLVLWLVLLLNVAQLQARQYFVWSFDAASRDVFARIEARHDEHPERPLRVAAMHWTNVPALNFYRVLRGATWMPEVENRWSAADTDFDCIVVRAGLHEEWVARNLQIVYSDAGSGVSLGVPRTP